MSREGRVCAVIFVCAALVPSAAAGSSPLTEEGYLTGAAGAEVYCLTRNPNETPPSYWT